MARRRRTAGGSALADTALELAAPAASAVAAGAELDVAATAASPTAADAAVATPATSGRVLRDRATTAELVVVTRDSEADLARSLASIRESAGRAHAGLLFIDLGSSDGTRSFIARHAFAAQGVWLEPRDSFADAVAVAAAVSEADVIVLLRPTATPSSPEALCDLIEHLEAHPYAAIAVPALQGHGGRILRTVRPVPRTDGYAPVECALGVAMAIRREELQAVGTLRRRAAGRLEELDLCMRLRRRGREIHYLRAVRFIDAGGRTASRVCSRRLSRRARMMLALHPGFALRLHRRPSAANGVARGLARGFDIVAALALIVVLAPLLLAIALAVRLDSSGPALFRQVRLGIGARSFQMFKFRTMQHNADPRIHQQFVREMIGNNLAADVTRSVTIFKVHPDPRVTRVGRLLRRTSLDELPQLFNILRGEMTFVGFRPPIPYELDAYPEWYYRRFDSKPGLTGLWQVSGRNERSYDEMVRLDIEYANRRSWLFAAVVLIRTIGVVLSGRGAC